MKQVICSHGFGVDATDRGLFSDIAAAFPGSSFTMFDYNLTDTAGNMTVRPLDNQVKLLNEQLAGVAGDQVTLLCHSQGCVTAAMAKLDTVAQLIFLAPPDTLDIDRFVGVFGSRPGATFDPEGTSAIPRRDGTVTYIGKDYLASIARVDVQQMFAAAANQVPLAIIRAAKDEIVGQTSFPRLSASSIRTIPGGHDFSGQDRQGLIRLLRQLIG